VATLKWDKIGERFYQTGVDRGVLYPPDGPGVAWNGITGVEDSINSELKSYHLDGVKYLESRTPNEFMAKLKAYTYPDEFDAVNGVSAFVIDSEELTAIPGLDLHDQPPKTFSLSYRTRIGNDVEGLELGYKIHMIYNVVAVPENSLYSTLSDSSIAPIEFSWNLSATPVKVPGYRPTAHYSIDSRLIPPRVLKRIELALYGNRWNDATLPPIADLVAYFVPPEG
jgi:hypothetical protein